MSGAIIDGIGGYGDKGPRAGVGGSLELTVLRYPNVNDTFDLGFGYGYDFLTNTHGLKIGVKPSKWLFPYVKFDIQSGASSTTTSTQTFYKGIENPFGSAPTTTIVPGQLVFSALTGVEFRWQIVDFFGMKAFLEAGGGTGGFSFGIGACIFFRIPFGPQGSLPSTPNVTDPPQAPQPPSPPSSPLPPPQPQPPPAPPVSGQIKKLTDDSYNSFVSNGTVLVLFGADWCTGCTTQELTLKNLLINSRGRIKIGKINVDENQQTVRNLFGRAFTIPKMVLYKDGVLVKKFQGFTNIQQLTNIREINDKLVDSD